MTNKTRALLLSALGLPGIGQLYLQRYKSACLLIGISLFATVYVFSVVMKNISEIINKVIAGELAGEYSVIVEAFFEAWVDSEYQIVMTLIYILIATWAVSIIDILRLKK